jgi:hypothetical protein
MQAPAGHPEQLTVLARRFYAIVLACDAVFIIVTLLSDLKAPVPRDIIRLFDLKLEINLAVWYSSALLLLVAAVAFAIAFSPPPRGAGRKWYSRVWILIGLFFLALSADETAQVHERVGYRLTRAAGESLGTTFGLAHPAYGWVALALPFAAVFIIVVLLAARWWLGLHGRTRRLTLCALACWAGVIVAEIAEERMIRWSVEPSVRGLIEEGLEIAGATLFLIAFTEYLLHTRAERKSVAGPRTVTAPAA